MSKRDYNNHSSTARTVSWTSWTTSKAIISSTGVKCWSKEIKLKRAIIWLCTNEIGYCPQWWHCHWALQASGWKWALWTELWLWLLMLEKKRVHFHEWDELLGPKESMNFCGLWELVRPWGWPGGWLFFRWCQRGYCVELKLIELVTCHSCWCVLAFGFADWTEPY